MEIIQTDIYELKPNEKNPRKITKAELKKLERSIKEFGFVDPVIVNKNKDRYNIVIGGHQRLQAAKKLGMQKVPVNYVDLTEEKEHLLNIALNEISGAWDDDKLLNLLKELNEKELDLSLTGFDDAFLTEMLKDNTKPINDEGEFIEVSAYERAKKKTKIQKGDLFKLGNHRLLCGDSTNESEVNRLMDKQIMHLMVTDPPYGVKYDPKWRDEADKSGLLGNRYPTRALADVSNDDRIDWSEAYKLFNGNVAYVWHAGKFTKQVQESLEICDFEVINQIIWVKPHFILSRGDYHWKHEPCLYVVKKGKPHNYVGDRSQTTVWQIAGMNCFGGSNKKEDEMTGHGTQKPLDCMATPIWNNSVENNNIYDPFGGSGTTLIACEQLKRKCFMMEIDPVYCQVIIDRWEKYTGKKVMKL
jgi:DNA modification methylase